MPDPGYVLGNLVARQLPTLPGLGALGYLYLQLVGVDQVLGRYPEATASHLLYGAAPPVAVRVAGVAVRLFAPLAGVGLTPEPVHRDRQGLVGLLGDGAERHPPGTEALDYLLGRLDLFQWHGLLRPLEVEEAPERRQARVLGVEVLCELLEGLVALGPDG